MPRQIASMRPRGRLRLGEVWLAVPALLVLGMAWSSPNEPVDFWMHVNSGAWMAEHRSFVTQDRLTFTIFGQPVLNQSWLAQLLMYLLAAVGGYPLAQAVLGALYGVTAAIMTRLAYRMSGSVHIAVGLAAAGALLMHNNLGIRPQVFATLLFIAELGLLLRHEGRCRHVWAIAIIEVVWVNTHGSFLLGVALPSLFFCGRAVERLIVAEGTFRQRISGLTKTPTLRYFGMGVVVAAIAMFANPTFSDVILYVLGVTRTVSAYEVTEWIPTWKSQTGIYFGLSVGLCIAVMVLSRRRPSGVDIALLLAFSLLGITSQRMVIWWAIVMPLVLVPYVVDTVERFRKRNERVDPPRYLNTVFLALLIGFVVMCSPWLRARNPLLTAKKKATRIDDAPYDAVVYLHENRFKGRLFIAIHHAAYVSWVLGADVKVFADARLDFFPNRIWDEYFEVHEGRKRALEILDRYHVDAVIADRRSASALMTQLVRSRNWTKVYSDDAFVVFSRKP